MGRRGARAARAGGAVRGNRGDHAARARHARRLGGARLRPRARPVPLARPKAAPRPARGDLRRVRVETAASRPRPIARGLGEGRAGNRRSAMCARRILMAKIICYTSPGRGHLFPTVPILLELKRRGHEVLLLTLRQEMARISATGLRVRAIAEAIEAIAHDDYAASSPTGALDRAVRVMASRAAHEVPDLENAIRDERPDGLLVDFNCWGGAAVAEKSGLPWALFMPYFMPWRLPGLPPFGPGLAPRNNFTGRVRDRVVGGLVHGAVNRNLPKLNAVRARVGLPPLEHMAEQGRSAPRLLYYTAVPFEYACDARPASVVMVGPLAWDPPAPPPEWLARVDR